jgi:hypothetical protein
MDPGNRVKRASVQVQVQVLAKLRPGDPVSFCTYGVREAILIEWAFDVCCSYGSQYPFAKRYTRAYRWRTTME